MTAHTRDKMDRVPDLDKCRPIELWENILARDPIPFLAVTFLSQRPGRERAGGLERSRGLGRERA